MVVFFIVLGIAVVGLTATVIREFLHRRKMYEQLDEPIEESPAVTVRARVIAKRSEIENIGGPKYPHSTLFCYVTFSTDAGEVVEHSLPKEIYGTINEHDYGTLITVDGKFFAFDKLY